jgi:hypothetical protein
MHRLNYVGPSGAVHFHTHLPQTSRLFPHFALLKLNNVHCHNSWLSDPNIFDVKTAGGFSNLQFAWLFFLYPHSSASSDFALLKPSMRLAWHNRSRPKRKSDKCHGNKVASGQCQVIYGHLKNASPTLDWLKVNLAENNLTLAIVNLECIF